MKRFNVVETVVVPDVEPATRVVKPNLSWVKATDLRDTLNDKECCKDLNPNRLVSYMVSPAN